MAEFNKEDFIADLRKTSKDIAEQSLKIGSFIGIDAGFKMMEQVLDRDDVPDPMPKELLRTFLKEFQKLNEDNKQKYLNHE